MHQLYRVQKIGNISIKYKKLDKRFIPKITHNINYDVVSDTKVRTTRDSILGTILKLA